MNKHDVFALLPTGGGKSICYQIPALLNDGVCLVVSPLIALMEDQVNSLVSKGIPAIAITSKLSESEIIRAFDNMLYGKIKLLYLSPEKLQSEFIQQKIKQLNVSLFAIDEAHCISEWGHDFRPSYLKLTILKEIHPNTPLIALTATATKQVQNDIITFLDLNKPVIFKETFQRKNLAYQVFETEDMYHTVKRILLKNNAPTIIYVNTRNKTKIVSDYLNAIGFKSTYYHGGLSAKIKENHFKNWMTESAKIMVATNAFGMGIDKDNVKVVIHIELPNSIENYVQEAGRAGRNGQKSFSVLLYNMATLHEFKHRIEKNNIQLDFIKQIYKHLNQHLFISKGELSETAYLFNLQDFCTKYKLDAYQTFEAIQVLEKESVLTYNQNFNQISTVRFKRSSAQVLNYIQTHHNYKNIIQFLLRTYGGIFENRISIIESLIARKLHITKTQVIALLKQLSKDGIIDYLHQTNDSQIQFLVMREDHITINRISKSIRQRHQIKKNKSESIIRYISDNKSCRNKYLLSYFNEIATTDCGICDVCIAKKHHSIDMKHIQKDIVSLLEKNTELSSKDIVILLKYKSHDVITAITQLLEHHKIELTQTNTYKIK